MLQALIHGAAGPFMILLFHLCCSSEEILWEQRDSPAVKITCCSCRGRGFSSQHPCWLKSTCNSSSRGSHQSSDPCRFLCVHGLYTSTQVHRVLCDLTFCPTLRQSPQQRDLRGFPVACDLRFEVGSAFYPSPWSVFKMLLMQGKFP